MMMLLLMLLLMLQQVGVRVLSEEGFPDAPEEIMIRPRRSCIGGGVSMEFSSYEHALDVEVVLGLSNSFVSSLRSFIVAADLGEADEFGDAVSEFVMRYLYLYLYFFICPVSNCFTVRYIIGFMTSGGYTYKYNYNYNYNYNYK